MPERLAGQPPLTGGRRQEMTSNHFLCSLTSAGGDVLTSMGSISLAMEGERDRDLRWDLGSSSRDGVLDGVKLSMEST